MVTHTSSSIATIALKELFSARCKSIDAYLGTCLQTKNIPDKLRQAMEYSLLAGGKRLRPVLCLTAASLAGCQPDAVLPFAAAIELIHTYSLIHDDLPAMDNDDLRRGKPSNHKAFGEATALLAGDALLTEAFCLMTEARVEPGKCLLALREIATAAGPEGMCAGQELDMEWTGTRDVQLKDLQHLHRLKTGALLRASCTSGVLLGSDDRNLYGALSQYGAELGIAFQIVDDILDEVADPETLGKPVHSDRDNGKTTYPLLCGLEESRVQAHNHSQAAQKALQDYTGEDQALLVYLAQYVVERVK
ncbi:MAG: polyprenyl synthetase family protein [Desulfovibrionaceae bacterium]|nr:polyprenyl synthetase family protein [Desulfovibrionaceae bacterium]